MEKTTQHWIQDKPQRPKIGSDNLESDSFDEDISAL